MEKQTFPHWQDGSRQLLYQTGYRQIDKQITAAQTNPPAPTTIPGIPAHLLDRVRQSCLRYRDLIPSEIASRCRWKDEPRINAAAVRAMLDTLSL